MKKLEDLPKKADYNVPDKYFDELPTRLQLRISTRQRKPWYFAQVFAFRYAVYLAGLVVVVALWFTQSTDSFMNELEQIDEAQLTYFIEDPDLTSEELAENYTWTTDDLEALEIEVYDVLDASDKGLEEIIDELDIENL